MNWKRWSGLIAYAIVLLAAFSNYSMAAEGVRPTVSFNHDQTKLPLTGMHTNTACESCHVKGVFKGTPTSCTDCHNRAGVVNAQMKPASHIPATQDCGSCHSAQGWLPTTFSHARLTQSCATCHNGTNQAGKPAGHIQTTKDCAECHKTTAWLPAGMDHSTLVPPAIGRCSDCHGKTATGKPANHVFTSAQCDYCHKSTSAWLPASYSHGAGDRDCQSCHNDRTATGKPGRHIQTAEQCSVCHTQAGWLPTSFAHTSAQIGGRSCANCHNGTSARGVTALHIPLGSNGCDVCHTPAGWVPTSFDHSKVNITGSPGENCTSCHNGSSARGKPTGHIPTTSYPQCVSCHSVTSWSPTHFDHGGVTSADNCTTCHNGTAATGRPTSGARAHMIAPMTSNTCGSCHRVGTSWTPATMNHAGVTSCTSCHAISSTGNAWTPGKASHISTAGHAQCSDCHTTSVWKPSTFSHQGISAASNCTVSCHNGTNATGRPVSGSKAHIVAPMTSTSCATCHTIGTSWIPATMNHTGITTCTTCHSYSGNSWTPAKSGHIVTGAQCFSCHTTRAWLPANFSHTVAGVTAATNCTQSGCHNIPNAGAPRAGQPTSGAKAHTVAPMTNATCANCHAIGGAWAPATMNHTGATSCSGCHSYVGNAWTITPATTHLTTSSPCSNCHTTNAWRPASWNHEGVTAATDCTQAGCHGVPNKAAPGSGRPTTGAKAHLQAPMTSNSCGSCHSIGTVWIPATMNHAGLTNCTSCHAISASGNGFTPGKANHISTAGHAQCSDCHATTAWRPTSFAHSGVTSADNCTTCHNGTAATGRPTSGTKAHTAAPMTSNTCGSCHGIGTGWTPTPMNHAGATSCTSCHVISAAGNAWTTGKSNHIATTGYTQCSSCHATSAWTPTSFTHTGVNPAGNCTTCHNGTSATGVPTTGAKAHTAAPMTDNTCGSCHTMGTSWASGTMNHTGVTSCTSCHAYTGNGFTIAKTNHVSTSSQCSACHTTSAWLPATNVHNGVTSATSCVQSGCHDRAGVAAPRAGRPTSGAQAHTTAPMTNATCGSCHAIGTAWTPATMSHAGATNCASCHAYNVSNGWTTPSPVATHMTTGTQCSSCHATAAWRPATFNHATNGVTTATDCTQSGCHNLANAAAPRAGRPTSGAKAHTTAPMTNNTCASCHAIGTSWAPATMNHTGATSCSTCHATTGNGWTPAPAVTHITTGSQCSSCHVTSAWRPATGTHNGVTSATNCFNGCHNGTSATGRPTSGAKAHTQAPLTNNTCGDCHNIGTTWAPATMNHSGLTSCTSCHATAGNGFTPAKANHISTAGYAQCSSCHLTSAWLPTTFAHSGLNAGSDCTTCHNGTAATGKPANTHTVAPMTLNTCASCHNIGGGWLPVAMNHSGATSCTSCHATAGNTWTPVKANHISTAGYAQCSSCHATAAWLPTTFAHTGVTAATNCTTCHNGTNATGRPTTGAKAHTVAPMTSNTCASCHTIGTAWSPATMNHSGLTACSTCHTYTGNGFTPAKANHLSTSSQCSSCHLTSAWLPATFNHAANGVTAATNCTQAGCHDVANAATPRAGRPTSGAKAHLYAPMTSATCATCHTIGGTWIGATMNHTGATSCSTCHAYNSSNTWTVPSPVGTHVPTTSQCSTCHTTTAWTGATYRHDGVTAATNCAQSGCHNVANKGTPGAGVPTSGSKAHTVAPMTSTTCGNCHAIGTAWTPATMNHTGLSSCTSCHATAGNGFTPAKPNHISTAGYAQCSSCHTTSAWLPTSFSHTGVTAASNCTTCHNGTNAAGRPTSGVNAHMVSPMTSTTCGSCHSIGTAWVPATMNHTGATLCASCHVTPAGNAWTPAKSNHISTAGYAQCSSCHNTTLWSQSSFSHSGITAASNCSTCHNGTAATGTPTGAKAHTVAPMTSGACGSCHTIGTTWTPATMNHSGLTACSGCHSFAGNGFTPTKAGHISTTGYGECSSCHATTAWLPTSFQHTGLTAASNCTTCHNGTNAIGRPTSGAKAHTYAPMTNATCGSCHTIGTAWTPATMNHTGVTSCTICHNYNGNGFTPAKTNHIVTVGNCSDCHATAGWLPTSFAHTTTQIAGKTCKDCHNGAAARGPVSSHAGISPVPYNCDACHRTTAWDPATFAHSGVTSGCTNCHKVGFATAKSSSHFITTQPCEKCHTTTAWSTIKPYMHTSPNYKPHAGSPTCVMCHIGTPPNEVISGAPHMGNAAYKPSCAWCHAQQFRAGEHKKTTSPTTVLYTVAELKDCSGACHEYTNNSFTTIKTNRTGEHHATDGSF